MNKKIKLTERETSATNRDFFNLFRPIAPSIDLIGKVAQVISAVTEAITIWHISQMELAGSSKIVAITVSLIATILVVAVLELGGRKFLQVATRTLVWKRFKNSWYIALFAIVSMITIGMGVMSFRLSTNGINHAFVSNVPIVTSVDNSRIKGEYREDVKLIIEQFDSDRRLLSENQAAIIERTADKYDARIEAANAKAANYDRKFASGEKWAKSQASKQRANGIKLATEKSNTLAVIQSKHTEKLDRWQSDKNAAIALAKTEMKEAVAGAQETQSKILESDRADATFWGGLFSWLVGFSVILAFVCIISVEVFRRGSGIEVEFDEEDLEPTIMELVWTGVSARWNGFFRNKAQQFAMVSAPTTTTQRSIGFDYPSSPAFAENEYNMPTAQAESIQE